MKFSYCMLPDYPLDESIEMIKTADELGFYACLLGRRDLAEGPVGAVRGGGGQDAARSASGLTSRTSSCASRR